MIPFLVGIGAALWIGSSMSDNKPSEEEKVTREIDESDVPPDVREMIEQQEKELQGAQQKSVSSQSSKPSVLYKSPSLKKTRKKNRRSGKFDDTSNRDGDKNQAFISTWLELGYNLYYGRNGVRQNIAEAKKYFRKAAQAGSEEAQNMLRDM